MLRVTVLNFCYSSALPLHLRRGRYRGMYGTVVSLSVGYDQDEDAVGEGQVECWDCGDDEGDCGQGGVSFASWFERAWFERAECG